MKKKFKETLYHGEYLFNYDKVRCVFDMNRHYTVDVPKEENDARKGYFSIIYYYEGTGRYIDNGKEINVKKGSYLITGVNSHKSVQWSDELHSMCIHFKPELFEQAKTFTDVGQLYKLFGNINMKDNIGLSDLLVYADDTGEVGWLVKMVLREYQKRDTLYTDLMRYYIKSILIISMRKTSIFDKYCVYSDVVQYIMDYINENYRKNITLNEIADKLNYNRAYLASSFKKQMGYSFTEFLQRKRIYAATGELHVTNKKVSEIMYDVGYSDPKHFNELFHKYVGMSPLEYRKYAKERTKWYPDSDG